jgi:hypothetical protein
MALFGDENTPEIIYCVSSNIPAKATLRNQR